ncbi:MAG: antibiotic biosynthesis monooxygenase family protein [Bacteroidales bacterium]
MIHSIIRMILPHNKRVEIERILMSVAERTRVEPGCINCSLYQCIEDDHVMLIEELWQTNEDLERHLRSDDYLKVLLVVEMALEKPEIRFNSISCSTGVETIEKARSTLGRHPRG